ncbi:MAG: hypothetical protein ACRCV9_06850, partial [Burkholderiaceae bacterium]
MQFSLPIISPSRAAAQHHVVTSARLSPELDAMLIEVVSYLDEAAFDAGAEPLARAHVRAALKDIDPEGAMLALLKTA